MRYPAAETILLACGCERSSAGILSRRYESGFSVVGPVGEAALAVALAAQAPPTIAVIVDALAEPGEADALSSELMKTWGIETLVLPRRPQERESGEGGRGAAWRASDDRVAHICHALGDWAPEYEAA